MPFFNLSQMRLRDACNLSITMRIFKSVSVPPPRPKQRPL